MNVNHVMFSSTNKKKNVNLIYDFIKQTISIVKHYCIKFYLRAILLTLVGLMWINQKL